MTIDQLRAVRAILQFDASSTAAELVYYFVHELGVTPGDAWRAVYRRPPMHRAHNEAHRTSGRSADTRRELHR